MCQWQLPHLHDPTQSWHPWLETLAVPFNTIDRRFTDTQVHTIRKQAGKNIEISDIVATADAQGTLTFTDGVKAHVLDVAPGETSRCPGYIWDGAADVTITCGGANINLYAHVWKK